ncbi:hypothetical protein [Amycolatopsis sp. H20-H5]|uniref:hypothetical protein n=1 Tax=Amycolatopsis sp. H20-H5 TaxID=3046309 RepID=UPI002DBF6418|nr:hypothetical protein [Amycolatopsis sp. H20-H5]MEC3977199.1 hypothetical protein [Amycolatopsis sp. H20-H5]
MTRFVTKLALIGAVGALVAVPGTASAQVVQPVDEKSGPVSFANVASAKVDGGGSVITETQRSPLSPGQSKLSADRTTVPKDSGEKGAFGGHYELSLGRFSAQAQSAFPAGVASRDHNVVAALQATTVPTAVAETNYALLDNARGGAKPLDNTVLVLQGAKTSVDCSATNRTSASSVASKVWIRAAGDVLSPVTVPAGNAGLQVKGVKLGPAVDVAGTSKDTTTSDLTLTKVTAFDQLIRQDGWRDGGVTVAAGWRVDVVTHVRDANNKDLRDVRVAIVLGGVSCSLPKGFAAKAAGAASGDTTAVDQPAAPMKVPAGVFPPPAEQSSSRIPLGLGLLGGGALFAAVAMLLYRRRGSVRRR